MIAATTRSILLGAALTGAALAPFVGEPHPPLPSGGAAASIEALAGAIDREEDHITAHELAQWIRARRPGLRIFDLRPAAELAEDRVPGAESVSIASLVRMRFSAGETVVLLSDAGGHAAQAWVLLRGGSAGEIFFLRGGVREWSEDVLSPLLDPAGDPVVNAEIAALSRYFGGMPRVGSATQEAAEERTEQVRRRRGC